MGKDRDCRNREQRPPGADYELGQNGHSALAEAAQTLSSTIDGMFRAKHPELPDV